MLPQSSKMMLKVFIIAHAHEGMAARWQFLSSFCFVGGKRTTHSWLLSILCRPPLSAQINPCHYFLKAAIRPHFFFFFSPVSGPSRPTSYIISSPSQICIFLEEEKRVCFLLSRHKDNSKREKTRETWNSFHFCEHSGILFKGVIDWP